MLQVLSFLERHPDGVRADDVAEFVGKSASTAYHLLASLVREGFAVHEGRPSTSRATADVALLGAPAPDATRSGRGRRPLPAHPRARYLGVVRGGVIEITVVRGRRGSPRMPGLGTQISDNAHALAMGKVVLARLAPGGARRATSAAA